MCQRISTVSYTHLDVYKRQAQVISGGVSLDEVNENLECVKYPGIYTAGEVLDVDGDCGGYNLHFAFASGYHIAKTISKGR